MDWRNGMNNGKRNGFFVGVIHNIFDAHNTKFQEYKEGIMSTKSAMEARFSNREGFRIVSVPESMRPTAESIEEMGTRICRILEQNDVMRDRSLQEASKRIVR